MAESFDVVVVGGGPGGYAAALYGAGIGLSMAVVEKEKVGGTCLHRGRIPAKEFLETADVFRTVAGAKEFGVQADQPAVDFAVSQARKQKVVDQLWKGLQGLMKSRKITTVIGTGTYHGNKLVRVDDGSELKAKKAVILASGSVPRTIPGFDPDGKFVMTSDEVLALDKLPGSAVVIGAGAIGCEFASMMADLGTQVTLLEALPKMLPGCDSDVVDVVGKSFKKRGIDVRLGVKVEGHEPNGSQTTVKFGDGESVTVDAVVVSVGRRPLSDGLLAGVAKVEVDDKGFVTVDEKMRTSEPDVYAVGDLVATPQLAHVGFAEAIVAITDILGEDAVPVDYGKVPWCIYCHPEVAFAGMSEQAAKDAGIDVVVSKHRYIGNGRALIIGEAEGLVKVIARKEADGSAGPILGVHMVGPWVTEQLGQGYLAVNWEATPAEIGQFIQPHPTLSETFGETVLAADRKGAARLMADITMPQLGETVTEGTITKWFKQVGDQVKEDEVLFEVSTDKVDSEVPSPAAGFLAEILVQEGDTVDVGTKLAVITSDAPSGGGNGQAAVAEPEAAAEPEPEAAPEPEPEAAPEPEPEAAAPEAAPEPEPPPKAEAGDAGGRVLSPVVRKLITEHALDPAQIPGTGQGGRITRADVLAYIDQGAAPAKPAAKEQPAAKPAPAAKEQPAAKPAPAAATPAAATATGDDEVIPFSNIRRRTAEHMIRSKATSAHVLTAVEVDFENVDRVRRAAKDEFKAKEGFSLTYLSFISRAVIDALAEFPKLNASVGDDQLIVHRRIHLGIAVDLNFEGLLVPVIHDAQDKRLRAIAREVSDLAARARSKKLGVDDLANGTFTITNPGPFGTFITAPVINQPQVAILSTDGVKKRPVVVELPDGSDSIAVHPVGMLALSFDHRANDGAYASAFLAKTKEILETRDWAEEL